MTPAQIADVQNSFKSVLPIAEQAGALFYGRLFEIAPAVRPLFPADTTEQARKLMLTLATVVKGLDRLDTILPAVQALAVRHVAYGARPEHYPVVGEALIWTLEQGLGEAFTPEIRASWITAYTTLSGAMIEAAEAA